MKYFIGLLLVFLALAGGIYFYSESKLEELYYPDPEQTIEIPEGSSISEAVDIIGEHGLLKPAWFYEYYLKFDSRVNDKTLKAGYFSFDSPISAAKIIDKLFSGGAAPTKMVTVPEGLASWEIASIFQKELDIDSLAFINLIKNDSLLAARGINAPSAEGYLFPETYEFYIHKKSPALVIDRMLDYGENFWKAEIAGSTDGQDHLKTKHEILTFASVIEEEASREEEIYIVSGLYHNRLEIGMPLQANATVQYALGAKERVLNQDLKVNSPYNTYLNAGLPPGPICNPGKRAILAAVSPEANDYIYMVAKGDGSGAHYFARSEREHINNVNKYKRARSGY